MGANRVLMVSFLAVSLGIGGCGDDDDDDDDDMVIDAARPIDASAAVPDAAPDDAAPVPDAAAPDAGCPACTDAIGCKMVDGKQMFAVSMDIAGNSGNTVCAAVGMTCVDTPVFTPPQLACLAFHPGVPVTSDVNGWRQSVYCTPADSGLACAAGESCHDCPLCLADSLSCGTANSVLLTEVFVECACP